MTALAAWQAEIGGRLLVGDRPELPERGTPASRAGWPVTLSLYRQWRLFRIRSLAPLTLVRLGERADLVVDAYLAANAGSTSYASTEAAAFLRFAAAAAPEDRYLDEIAFLELALIRARRPAGAELGPASGYLARSQRATVRTVPFPAIRLMLWLAGLGDRPHATTGGEPVLIAPAVTGWVRPGTVAEAAVWHWLAMQRPHHLLPRGWAEPVNALRAAGAVH